MSDNCDICGQPFAPYDGIFVDTKGGRFHDYCHAQLNTPPATGHPFPSEQILSSHGIEPVAIEHDESVLRLSIASRILAGLVTNNFPYELNDENRMSKHALALTDALMQAAKRAKQ